MKLLITLKDGKLLEVNDFEKFNCFSKNGQVSFLGAEKLSSTLIDKYFTYSFVGDCTLIVPGNEIQYINLI